MSKSNTSSLPLLYTNPQPLDKNNHRGVGIKERMDLGFTAHAHAIPINMIECAQISLTYPIVFASDEHATPVAVLGLQEGENLFLTPDGRWFDPAAYIPSYIRRYPFILAEIAGTQQMTLCVDDNPDVLVAKSPHQLLDASGNPSELTKGALEYCKSFQAAALHTRAFSDALRSKGLLVKREAQIPIPGGKDIRFGGFQVLDDEKFAALDDATVLAWRKEGWLSACYAILFSTPNWGRLARLHAMRSGAPRAA